MGLLGGLPGAHGLGSARMGESFDPEQSAEFDKFASDYEEVHSAVVPGGTAYFADCKRRVLERILGQGFADPVLDFGCGVGNLTRFLTTSFPVVHGYDPSSGSARVAAERAPRARFFHDVESI